MQQVTRGLVIRTVDYKDADRILTVLSEDLGKITVGARGVRRKNSRLRAAGQLFAWSQMTLYERHGRYSLNEAEVLEQFHGLSLDLDSMALASYIAEVLGTEAEGDRPDPQVLRLALNAFHALSQGGFAKAVVKAGFELRYMALTGYRPDLGACGQCEGGLVRGGYFSPSTGIMRCEVCGRAPGDRPMDVPALEAARYILSAPLGRIFSFRLAEPSLALLADMCESYLLACMERGFRTLDFYRDLNVK